MKPIDPRNGLKCFLITQAEWDALPEYSLSRPTGIEDGKLWKAYRGPSSNGIWAECWILCEYKIVGDLSVTYFYKPVFVEEVPEGERRFWTVSSRMGV